MIFGNGLQPLYWISELLSQDSLTDFEGNVYKINGSTGGDM